MQSPPHLGARCFVCNVHKPLAINFEHPYREGLAPRLVYHRLVLAEPKGLLFGPAGAYAVANAQVNKLVYVLGADVADDAAHCGEGYLLRIAKKHMPPHQTGRICDRFARKLQPLEQFFGHPGPYYIVAVEGPVFFALVIAAALRFAYVVQQGRQAHRKRPVFVGRMLQSAQVMLPYVVFVGLVLLYAYPLLELRHNIAQKAQFLAQNKGVHRFVGVDYPHKLRLDTLFGYLFELVSRFSYSGKGVCLYGKAKLGRNAYSAHKAQGILLKPSFRIPYCTYDSGLDVLYPVIKVNQLTLLWVIGQCIDSKVAALKVIGKALAKYHLVWPPKIAVAALESVGCDFHNLETFVAQARVYDAYGAKFVGVVRFVEQTLDNLGRGVGSNIPVLRFAAQQQVAHASAHNIGLVPCSLERFHNREDL